MFGKCQFLWGRLAVRYWGNYFEESIKPATPRGIALVYCPSMCWRRYLVLLAQVPSISGAGVEKGVSPAPTERMRAHFVAQVPCRKSHLRQKSSLPAPQTATICARIIRPLHHLPPASRRVDCRQNWSMRPNGSELVGRGEKVLGGKVLGKKELGERGCFRKATPGSRRGILRRSRGWRGGRCGCRRSSGR